jgi:cyclopropane-fatty-acyl-phospholipid synthase
VTDPTSATLRLLDDLFADGRPPNFAVRLWDETVWPAAAELEPRFTLVLRHPGSLPAMLWPPTQLAAAEAYIYDDIDIEGDFDAVFELADYLLVNKRWTVADRFALARRIRTLPRVRTPRAGKREVSRLPRPSAREYEIRANNSHFDLPNAIFPLFLGKHVLYSCGYFASSDEDLDTAQERKLELLCRKLRLRQGERLLDIGLGWGGFAIYAAETFGVRVDGVTPSALQAETARRFVRDAGLEDRVRVIVADCRDLPAEQAYDKIAAIEMFEHVSNPRLPEFFTHVHDLLRPGGAFLLQGIAEPVRFDRLSRRGRSFIHTWIWPNAEVVPVHHAVRCAELGGFELRDVESLREHYTLTLKRWARNLENAHDEFVSLTDEQLWRAFRLWTAGGAYGTAKGAISVYQSLFVKPREGVAELPFQRADWYTDDRTREPTEIYGSS